jgi:outer membrane protein assembly factor BamB
LWPGVSAVTIQWLAWFVIPIFIPVVGMYGMLAGALCGVIVAVWWLFFSRARWSERLGAVALIIAAVYATSFFVHESISNGMMGNMLYVFSIPAMSLAVVAWAVASRRFSGSPRWASMVAAILLGCGLLNLVRSAGVSGEGVADLRWRWSETPEERLLALDATLGGRVDSARGKPDGVAAPPEAKAPLTSSATAPGEKAAAAAPAVKAHEKRPDTEAVNEGAAHPHDPSAPIAGAEWPGFRGPGRDGVARGVRIETDWSRKPPVELWRRTIGPGWSSFAVQGDVLYTQEQRGDDEIVAAYNAKTGEPVWRHRDAARFWESNGGAGPRGTPTLSNGRVYSLGATGIVNALDARSGAVVWTRNAQTDTGAPMPGWGFTSSPLVFNDLVIVATSGRLAGYDLATGNLRWSSRTGGGGYSSPHLVTIDGVPQIVLQSGGGATAVAPADGATLWQLSWEGISIVQPALMPDGDLVVTAGDAMGGIGVRRISVTRGSGGWAVQERWTSRGLKPYFNDLVVHNGHAFGFDGSILACIDLGDGTRKWKGGRYGHGQMVLLPDQDLLLVLSEDGELALVQATSDKFTELARVPALDGKTWNHPVLAGDLLFVRNGEEMAAYRLSLAGH